MAYNNGYRSGYSSGAGSSTNRAGSARTGASTRSSTQAYNSRVSNTRNYGSNGGFRRKKSILKPILIISLCIVFIMSAVLGVVLYMGGKGHILGVPQNLRNGDKPNSIIWDKVKNASSYKLRIDGNTGNNKKTKAEKEEYESDTKDNQQDLTVGDIDDKLTLGRTYTIGVKSIGQGKYKDSDYGGDLLYKKEADVNAIQLARPQNVRIEDDLLLWTRDNKAKEYSVYINGNNSNRLETVTPSDTVSSAYDLSNLPTDSYSIYIVAIGDGKQYSNSVPSSTVQYDNKSEQNTTQLDTPVGIEIVGTNFKWNAVNHATKYKVFNYNELLVTIDGAGNTIYNLGGLSAGYYVLSVMATSTDVNYRDSERSSSTTYQVEEEEKPVDPNKPTLSAPELEVDTNTKVASWSLILGSEGFELNIDGQNYHSIGTHYDISFLSGGTHYLKVMANGGDRWSDSPWSNVVTYDASDAGGGDGGNGGNENPPSQGGKLQAPNMKVNQVLEEMTWDTVNSASGYEVKLENPAVSYNAHLFSVDAGVTKFDLGAILDNEKPGAYNVSIKSVGNSDSSRLNNRVNNQLNNKGNNRVNNNTRVVWEDSDFSTPAQQFFVYNKNGTKQDPPINLHIEKFNGKDRLKWNWKDGTEQTSPGGYHYDFGQGVGFSWNNYAEMDSLEPGDVELKVRALPGNSETAIKQPSDWVVYSYHNTVPKLDKPTVSLDMDKYLLTWSAINGANQYEIDINGIPYTAIAPTTQFDLTILTEIKSYAIKVRAKDTNGGNATSDWSSTISYNPTTVPLPKPIVYVAGKNLNWFGIASAKSFEIVIDDATPIIVQNDKNYYDLSSLTTPKTYTIKMRAKGQGSYLDSAWSNTVNYLYTGNPPLTGPTSPDGAVARFESFGLKSQYDAMFAHRLGLQSWKDDAEAQAYYKDDADRNARGDFYAYDNFVAAIRNIATKKLEIYDRKGLQYWRSSRITMIDKETDVRTVIQRGSGEIDAEWNQDKEPITKIVDFGDFLNSPTNNANDNKRELAAFLANISHETNGGFRGANTPPGSNEFGELRFTYGLFWNEELDFINATSSYYQDMSIDTAYPPVPGHSYHGRGPIQITWNYNYGPFSWIVFNDKNVLLQNPELVAKDGSLGFMGAIWFWMMPDHPKASCHEIIHDLWTALPDRQQDNQYMPYKNSFALTVVIINGGFEAGKDETYPQLADRIGYYKVYSKRIGANIEGEKLDTKGMTPWQ